MNMTSVHSQQSHDVFDYEKWVARFALETRFVASNNAHINPICKPYDLIKLELSRILKIRESERVDEVPVDVFLWKCGEPMDCPRFMYQGL